MSTEYDEDDDDDGEDALDREPRPYYARTLDDVDPKKVAERALMELLRYAGNLTLGWKVDLPCLAEVEERSDLYALAINLTLFAQRGLPAGAWKKMVEVEDALERVVNEFFRAPLTHGPLDFDVIDDAKPSDDYDYFHLVVDAALARYRLDLSDLVTPRGLDALGSTVNAEWPARERRRYIPQEEALPWLIKHGVPGFAADGDNGG